MIKLSSDESPLSLLIPLTSEEDCLVFLNSTLSFKCYRRCVASEINTLVYLYSSVDLFDRPSLRRKMPKRTDDRFFFRYFVDTPIISGSRL
jgi:hypothetical protein